MTFTKNDPRINKSGRGPGKFTSLKNSFLEAFKSKELGGTEGLIKWASLNTRNRTTFYTLIAKMLPTNVRADLEGQLKIILEKKISEDKPVDGS
jgi:hypothetical protein